MIENPKGYTKNYLATVSYVAESTLEYWIAQGKVDAPSRVVGDLQNPRYNLEDFMTAYNQIREMKKLTIESVGLKFDDRPNPVLMCNIEVSTPVVETPAETVSVAAFPASPINLEKLKDIVWEN